MEAVGGLSEAQKLTTSDAFGVAIIDVRLTDDNPYDVQGIELLEHMQGQTDNPMPVVIMTGYAFEGLEETLKTRYGVQHFVKKGTWQDIREFLEPCWFRSCQTSPRYTRLLSSMRRSGPISTKG